MEIVICFAVFYFINLDLYYIFVFVIIFICVMMFFESVCFVICVWML